ncbi:hypothetical protein [Bradyrhizobium viridifuturi]|uniref:hypothetical protein n=1 Tax=Bradyrhizobium viridifuturi TaxID=1654716 RepID=UPI000A57F0A6|nr:hypothetical protein [Bradyrhizobium viridifuturi]
MNEHAWYEVWVDDTARPPYVLILLSDKSGSSFDIYDPGEKSICHTTSSYQDAMFWLTEDEYTKVDGRMDLA